MNLRSGSSCTTAKFSSSCSGEKNLRFQNRPLPANRAGLESLAAYGQAVVCRAAFGTGGNQMATDISLEQALTLFGSKSDDEFALGMNALFRRYVNRNETWNAFVKYFVENPTTEIPRALVYYLAHIPWHPDIVWTGDEPITQQTREYARQLLCRFGKPEVIKLLSCIEEETGIERGSIGQSVEAIVSSLPEVGPILANISGDTSLPAFTRECAAFIGSIKERRAAAASSEDWRVQAQRILRGGSA
jgi:hypothetical protein